MITIPLSTEDLTKVRLVPSPLWETVASFGVLLHHGRHTMHAPWVARARRVLPGTDLSALLAAPGRPAGPSDMMYMSAVGPLGRSAHDLRAALSVTGGPENQAAKAYTWTLSPSRHTRLEDFRVGVVLDHERAPVSDESTGKVLQRVVAPPYTL